MTLEVTYNVIPEEGIVVKNVNLQGFTTRTIFNFMAERVERHATTYVHKDQGVSTALTSHYEGMDVTNPEVVAARKHLDKAKP